MSDIPDFMGGYDVWYLSVKNETFNMMKKWEKWPIPVLFWGEDTRRFVVVDGQKRLFFGIPMEHSRRIVEMKDKGEFPYCRVALRNLLGLPDEEIKGTPGEQTIRKREEILDFLKTKYPKSATIEEIAFKISFADSTTARYVKVLEAGKKLKYTPGRFRRKSKVVLCP